MCLHWPQFPFGQRPECGKWIYKAACIERPHGWQSSYSIRMYCLLIWKIRRRMPRTRVFSSAWNVFYERNCWNKCGRRETLLSYKTEYVKKESAWTQAAFVERWFLNSHWSESRETLPSWLDSCYSACLDCSACLLSMNVNETAQQLLVFLFIWPGVWGFRLLNSNLKC